MSPYTPVHIASRHFNESPQRPCQPTFILYYYGIPIVLYLPLLNSILMSQYLPTCNRDAASLLHTRSWKPVHLPWQKFVHWQARMWYHWRKTTFIYELIIFILWWDSIKLIFKFLTIFTIWWVTYLDSSWSHCQKLYL